MKAVIGIEHLDRFGDVRAAGVIQGGGQDLSCPYYIANWFGPTLAEAGHTVKFLRSITAIARLRLPHDGRVDIFQASGAIAAAMSPPETRRPIADDERLADRGSLVRRAEELAATVAESHASADDRLQHESVWELKGRGVALSGEATPVALFGFLVAFRRYLHGLPVLGRASVHVAFGSGPTVTNN